MSIFSFETGIGDHLIAFPLLVVESGRAAPPSTHDSVGWPTNARRAVPARSPNCLQRVFPAQLRRLEPGVLVRQVEDAWFVYCARPWLDPLDACFIAFGQA